MKKISLKILVFAALFYGCSTDFNVIAPYKEVMIIDGLMDLNDSVQSVKVSKAYLGEGNALVMAKQSDSTNYGDILTVVLERVQSNQVIQTIPLNRKTTPYLQDKDTGVFASPYHVLYLTDTIPGILDPGSKYRIRVTNNETGLVATSLTSLVNGLTLAEIPPPNTDSIDFATAVESSIKINLSISSGSNAKIFDMIIRFHYREIDPSGNSTLKSIDWNFSDVTTSTSISEVKFSFYKYDLFDVIRANIPDMPGYTRRIDSLPYPYDQPFEFILIGGTEDLQTYMNLHKPSTSVSQDKPSFTTVENGLGIFTSRQIIREFRYPNQVTQNAINDIPTPSRISLATKNFVFN